MISPIGWVIQGQFALQNGGMSVDGAGNIYAVENNWGSSNGIGEATAFFLVDPITGVPNSVIPVLEGGDDVGFGFGSLEALPDGRVMAFTGGGIATGPLYEINPNTGEVTEMVAVVFPVSVDGTPNGLEATSDTNLLATTGSFELGELLSIDLDTNVVTEIGEQGIRWTDLAIHPTSGKGYTISHWAENPSNTAHLYEIDLTNGLVIDEIGDTGVKWISSIDFAPDGTLYGNDGSLVVIDINTGQGTTNGSFGGDPLEPLSQNNTFSIPVFELPSTDSAPAASIEFLEPITLPASLSVDLINDSILLTENSIFIDSTLLPFLDVPARITFVNLGGESRNILVDHEDDGTFESCEPPQCTLVSFIDGTLIFDVTGFTTYSSEDASDGDGGGGSGSGGSLSPWLLLSFILGIWMLRIRITPRYK